jgi:hypothetical protein
MKHFPASKAPARIEGLSVSLPSGSLVLRRSTLLLGAAVIAAFFFFFGAIAFGEALVRAHDTAPVSQLSTLNSQR